MPYGKRRKKTPAGVKTPDSPSRRREPWTTITVRAATYAMLRELAEYWKCPVGQATTTCVEKEFKKLLWEQEHAQIMQKVGRHVPRA